MINFENTNENYIPFSDGIILQTQGYSLIDNVEQLDGTYVSPFYENLFVTESFGSFNGDVNKLHKCEYCGKPDNNANCHAHKNWCPRYCKDVPQLSLGSDVLVLSFIILVFTLFKKFKKWN